MAGSASDQKRIGKYAIRRTLGQGGAGVVYECHDPDLDRSVAIKTLLPAADAEGEEHLRRFKTEAQALARLPHPNIVRIYDYDDRTERFPFIVMEFVEGGSLRQLLDPDHPMPPADAVGLVQQVLAGLAATHKISVIHRDIKPGNILMRGKHPLIADFGIARIADKRSTQVGTVIGTASYMAPEQMTTGDVDHRADIWSTGVLLYQMLTGHMPFDGPNVMVIMEAIRTQEPPPPSEHVLPGTIPAALDRVVLKALAKRPQDRFASADDFSRALEDALRAPSETDRTIVVTPRQDQPGQQVPRRSSRSPPWAWIAGAGGGVLLAAAGIAAWIVFSPQTPKPIGPVAGVTQSPAVVPAPQPVPSPVELAPPTPVPSPDPGPATGLPQPPAPDAGEARPAPAPAPPAPVPPILAPPVATPQPAPPSLAPAAEPPPPAPAPRPTLAELRALIDQTACLLVGGTLDSGRMALTGLGLRDAVRPVRELWEALRNAAAPQVGSRFDVAALAPVPGLCDTIALLRPYAAPLGSVRPGPMLRVEAASSRPTPGMPFSLVVSMGDTAGWVQIDYFSFADNQVFHPGLHMPHGGAAQNPPPHAIQLPAGAQGAVFEADFGTPGEDVLVLTVSRERLFPRRREDVEDVPTYLAALRQALQGRPPGSVAIHAVPVIIQPGP